MKLYHVHPEIARSIQALNRESLNALIRILSIPSRLLRAGATLAPEFIARNSLTDQLSAFVYSKYGFIPGMDLAQGTFALAKKQDEDKHRRTLDEIVERETDRNPRKVTPAEKRDFVKTIPLESARERNEREPAKNQAG